MVLESATRYRFARFELEPGERRLLNDRQPVTLGSRAFDLLLALVERHGQLVTKGELLARIWGKVVVEDNALQAHISALRKALGPEAIATVQGQGYRFTLRVESLPLASKPPAPIHNLPQPLTSFIGREREIVELQRLLAGARLLTLSGAGGCGKTRLALQVASLSLHGFADGVWLAELAPLGDASLMAHTVAKALSVAAKPREEIIDTVAAWIGGKRMLLLLDNAEHLLEACAYLSDRLLRRCANLSFLVTSRERLGVHGEQIYQVPSLSVPTGREGVDVMASEAVRLFIARASLQQPGFELMGHDVQALASICKRLDGIALAIELAAPRVRLMSLQTLSQHLDDRFHVLTDGSRTALPRHRTLRSLIDWSYELLTEPEKAVLRRASVFAGGSTLEAAEHVCVGDGVAPTDVLDLLTSLIDKNLIVADFRAEETRFGMLETMRHYAQEQLRVHGEEPAAVERHIAYLTRVAAVLRSLSGGVEFRRALIRIDGEKDNVRAALARCESDPERLLDGLRLASLLHTFWSARAYWEEGRAWLARLLAAVPASGRGEVVAQALHTRGQMEAFGGQSRAGLAPLQEAASLWRQLGLRLKLGRSLGAMGSIELKCGDPAAARALFEEVLSIAREVNDLTGVSMALSNLAQAAVRLGEPDVALVLLDELLPLSRAVGPLRAAGALSTLGWVRHVVGDQEGARAALWTALGIYREADHLGDLVWNLSLLSEVLQDLRDIAAARSLMREALDTAAAEPGSWLEAARLGSIAGLAVDIAGSVSAARLYGQVQRLCDETGQTSWNPQRQQRLVTAARRALQDDDAFDGAWNEGKSWSYEEAFQYACALVQDDPAAAGAQIASGTEHGGAAVARARRTLSGCPIPAAGERGLLPHGQPVRRGAGFKLLVTLVERGGLLLTKRELCASGWGGDRRAPRVAGPHFRAVHGLSSADLRQRFGPALSIPLGDALRAAGSDIRSRAETHAAAALDELDGVGTRGQAPR